MSLPHPDVVVSLALWLAVVAAVDRWLLAAEHDRLVTSVLGPRAPRPRWGRIDAVLRRLPVLSRLDAGLRAAGSRLRLTDVLLAAALAGAVVHRLLQTLVGPTAALPLAAVAVPWAVFRLVDRAAQRRRERVIAQVPELTRLLAGAARAGLSMTAALERAARDIGEPTAGELRLVVLQIRTGHSLADAMEAFAARLGGRDLDVLTSAISIQQRSGGDLVRLLTRLGQGLEASRRSRQEARSVLAGIGAQGYVAAGLGLVMASALNRSTDGGLERALDKPLAAAGLAVCVGLLVLVLVVVNRLLDIDR